jgi:hypothetical protein
LEEGIAMDDHQERTAVGLGERVFAGAIGIIFLGQFCMALRYPSDPRLFPLIVAVAGGALAVSLVAGFGLHDATLGPPKKLPRASLLLTLGVSPAYGFCLWVFGYWIATLVAIPVVSMLLGYRKRTVLVLVTAGVTAALGIVFPLLAVPLPKGMLPAMLG